MGLGCGDVAATKKKRYLLKRKLGEGGAGKVYKGEDEATKTAVAVKVVKKSRMEGMSMGELEALERLRHPNIIRYLDLGHDREVVFMVMEYMDQGELSYKVIDKSEDKARYYFTQIMKALDYCHSKGICHRDVKPANLLRDSKGNVKLADFGLCSGPHTDMTKEGLLLDTCGTRNYQAPEVIDDYEPYSGPKADTWSAAVTLWYLVAGKRPGFVPASSRDLKGLKIDREFPKYFSHDLRQVLTAMLNPNPRDRITVSQALKYSWFTLSAPSLSPSTSGGSGSKSKSGSVLSKFAKIFK